MDLFFKAAGLILITVILSIFLGKWEKDIGMVLTIAACCIAGACVFHYLEPVLSFLTELTTITTLQDGVFPILLKVVGITLISEIAGTICSDAGNGSLAKILQLLGTSVIVYLSLPIFEILLDILKEILGEL